MRQEERFDFIETEESTNQKALDDIKWHRRKNHILDSLERQRSWIYKRGIKIYLD